MKKIFKSLLLVMLISFVACEKSLEELNVDPNNSPTAAPANVLTAAQGYIGFIVDVDLNFDSFIWAQYKTWGTGVSIGNSERFVAQPDDHDGYWQRAYANALTDLKFLSKSEDRGYSGVGKALQVYVYQGLVDHFGSIPFSDAINGEIADGSVLTPTFDDPAAIYAGLVTILDEAIADLALASGTGMGSDDLVYGGDIAKWQKFTNSLKLRLLMRLSETGARGGDVQALINAGNFIDGPGDIAAVPFDGQSGDENPMFARASFGVGDFYFASLSTLDLFETLADPRGTAFYSVATTGSFAGSLRGIPQGSIDDFPFSDPSSDFSGSSEATFGPALPVILMSDWEVKFLRAEAAARYGTSDDEEMMLGGAITANFNHFAVGGDTIDLTTPYIASLNYGGAANLDAKLDIIGVQKWIALNGTQEDEGWIEARRFDRPASRIFTEGIWQNPPLSVLPAGQFPASWLYPASERSLNPNAPGQRVITDRIFWDN